jgi:cysteine-rich repeat protein
MCAPLCGNGVIDPGEQCDDGNRVDGDCCSASCQIEPAGSVCNLDDGLYCDGAETCQGRSCVRGPKPCALLCDEINNRCVTGCLATPQICEAAASSSLLIRNSQNNEKDRMIWKAAGVMDDVGLDDPVHSTDYVMCVYAGTTGTLLGQAVLPASPFKWQAVMKHTYLEGYKYKDSTGVPNGIVKGMIRVSALGQGYGNWKIDVKGTGPHLPDLPLPPSLPLRVQLIDGSNGRCWDVKYDSAQFISTGAPRLEARTP